MIRFLIICGVATLMCFSSATAAAQGNEDAAVQKLLDRSEQAWEKHDVAALGACYSDAGMLSIGTRAESSEGAWVGGKQQLLEMIAKAWKQMESHRFVERDIEVQEDLAWMQLTIADKLVEGGSRLNRVWAAAVREGDEWRMCFSMPLIASPAVFAEGVLKGSQAEGLGIQPGDKVISYAGRQVSSAMSLVAAVNSQAKSGSQVKIPLVIRRGLEELRLDVEPGRIGIKVSDRLLPMDDSMLVGADQPHPVKDRFLERIRGSLAGDVDRSLQSICPAGFLGLLPAHEGKPVQLITQAKAREMGADALKNFQEMFDLSTLEVKDVRVIAQGDLAMPVGRIEVMKRNKDAGKAAFLSAVEVYVRQKGQWWLAAALPFRMEIGSPGTN